MTSLVDTDWIVDALHGIPQALATLRANAADGLAVSIITFGELYDGAFALPDPDAHLAVLRDFLSEYIVIGLTDEVMEFFGRTRNRLRRQGTIIPDLDLLIAATAVVNNLTLMTRNLRHFSRVEGLQLYR